MEKEEEDEVSEDGTKREMKREEGRIKSGGRGENRVGEELGIARHLV